MSPLSPDALWRLDVEILRPRPGMAMKYRNCRQTSYTSPRYGKTVTVEVGFLSDGASGPARDILSMGWLVHDKVCTGWKWDDGTRITRWQAAMILSDILKEEGHGFCARTWKWATFWTTPLWAKKPKKYKTQDQ